jgi:hypothetical protein
MDRNGAQEKDVAHLSLYLFLGECLRLSRKVLLFSTFKFAEMVLASWRLGCALAGYVSLISRLQNSLLRFEYLLNK